MFSKLFELGFTTALRNGLLPLRAKGGIVQGLNYWIILKLMAQTKGTYLENYLESMANYQQILKIEINFV